ncbi:hypothetical protein PTKIN_Ptkin10aG0199500 [Pterospermum kingtungense]
MDAAEMQISLRKFDEAINTLKGIVQRTKNEKYSENQALSFLKRALALIEKEPQEQHGEGTVSARNGSMLLLRGDVPRVIPYLESAVERFKETFPCKHFVVGHNYNNLGVAYLEPEKPHSVVQMFAAAKDNLVVSLGPHHPDSIVACLNLPIACGAMGR